jgi:hypothetical protein
MGLVGGRVDSEGFIDFADMQGMKWYIVRD